jgi:hypothetical protein
MPFPTTNAKYELAAVNEILASVGQAPVTTLDQTNPDVAIAAETLTQVSREVQAEGWTFNREYDYPFKPDTDKFIRIPENILQIDLTDEYRHYDAVRRDGRLYDRTRHTYEWEDEILRCDVLWLFDWVDLPKPIQDYILARASAIVSTRIVGDGQQFQMLQQKEAYTRAFALEYDCNQGDYTFFGHPRGGNFYNSYQPYHTLSR